MSNQKAVLIAVIVWVVSLFAIAFFVNSYDNAQFKLKLASATAGAYDTTHVAQTPLVIPPIKAHAKENVYPQPDAYLNLDSLNLALGIGNIAKPEQDRIDSLLSPFGVDTTVKATIHLAKKDTTVNANITVIADPISRVIFMDFEFDPIPRDSIPQINHIEYVQASIPFYESPYLIAPLFLIIGYELGHAH